MIIDILPEYRIKSDQYSWAIQKLQHGKRSRWKSISWYPSLPMAVQGLVERAGRDLPGTYQLDEALGALSALSRACRAKIEGEPRRVRRADAA